MDWSIDWLIDWLIDLLIDDCQVIVLVSDGDHANHEDPVNERLVLENSGVHIFTVGVGAWLRTSIMRNLATRPDYYADRGTWERLLHDHPTNLRPGSQS